MDKYLASKSAPSSAGAKGSGPDLLSLMRVTNAPTASPWSVPAKENESTSNNLVDSGWAKREATVNSTVIKCNERTKSLNTDIKGWKVVDNQKVYTTFRNGKVVSASGFEGFKLSSGDKPKVKSTDTGIGNVGTKRKALISSGETNPEKEPKKSTAHSKQLQQQLKW